MNFPRAPARSRVLIVTLMAAVVWGDLSVAQGFNRLFLTREQRLQLDIARRDAGNEPIEVRPEPRTAQVRPDPLVGQLTVNGVVIRSGGRNTSWINGRQVAEGTSTPEGIRVEGQGREPTMRLRLPSGVDTVQLRPGQKIDVASGKVFEAYEKEAPASARNAFDFDETAPRPPGGAAEAAEPTAAQSERAGAGESSAVFALRRLIELAIGGTGSRGDGQ